MVSLIALLLFFFWWVPVTFRKLPLPRTGILRTLRRLGTHVVKLVKKFFTLVLIRPSQRVAQRHGWFLGLWTFCFLLSILLTIVVNLVPVPGGGYILFLPLSFVVAGGILAKAFPHRFDYRALYPLPRRRRHRKWRSRRR